MSQHKQISNSVFTKQLINMLSDTPYRKCRCYVAFLVILLFCIILFPYQSWPIDTGQIIKLKQKGYTDEQIREIIDKQKGPEPDLDIKSKKVEAMNLLKERLSLVASSDLGFYRPYKIEIEVHADCIMQETYMISTYSTKDAYTNNLRLCFSNLKAIDIQSTETNQSLGLIFSQKRVMYFILTRAENLKQFKFYLKEPYCYERYEAEKILQALITLRE
jgi:hypothetical protein